VQDGHAGDLVKEPGELLIDDIVGTDDVGHDHPASAWDAELPA
jgi:hypothetical protein